MPLFRKKKPIEEAELTVPPRPEEPPEPEQPRPGRPKLIPREESYEITIGCSNCGETYDMEIRRGTPVTDELKNESCTHCGCKGYFVRVQKEEK